MAGKWGFRLWIAIEISIISTKARALLPCSNWGSRHYDISRVIHSWKLWVNHILERRNFPHYFFLRFCGSKKKERPRWPYKNMDCTSSSLFLGSRNKSKAELVFVSLSFSPWLHNSPPIQVILALILLYKQKQGRWKHEMFKARLDETIWSSGWHSCQQQQGWNWMIFKILSNPSLFMIL